MVMQTGWQSIERHSQARPSHMAYLALHTHTVMIVTLAPSRLSLNAILPTTTGSLCKCFFLYQINKFLSHGSFSLQSIYLKSVSRRWCLPGGAFKCDTLTAAVHFISLATITANAALPVINLLSALGAGCAPIRME